MANDCKNSARISAASLLVGFRPDYAAGTNSQNGPMAGFRLLEKNRLQGIG